MKVKIGDVWHVLKPGEFVLFDHITKTVKIATVSFQEREPS